MALWRFFKSIKYAIRGLEFTFKNENNFRIQVTVGCLVLLLSWFFPLLKWERVIIIMLVGLVLVAEILNTALEYFTDLLKPRLNNFVYIIKDLMAASVLVTSLVAAVVGIIIFLPYFVLYFVLLFR